MKHPLPSIRPFALFVVLGIALSACGAPAMTAAGNGDYAPAATLLSKKEARLLPTPSYLPTPSPTEAAPSAAPLPTRKPGPPGNPIATTLAQPPTPGRYPMRVTVAAEFGQESDEFELIVRRPATVGAGLEQVQRWDIEEFESDFTYKWFDDRVLHTRFDGFNPDGSELSCDYEPPILALRLPLRVEAEWSSESSCNGNETTTDSKVVRTEKLTVAGQEADAFVIESTSTGRTDDGQEYSFQSREWYVPAQRLFAIVERDFGQILITAELLSLTPQS